jgi:hypothetical protein
MEKEININVSFYLLCVPFPATAEIYIIAGASIPSCMGWVEGYLRRLCVPINSMMPSLLNSLTDQTSSCRIQYALFFAF